MLANMLNLIISIDNFLENPLKVFIPDDLDDPSMIGIPEIAIRDMQRA